MERLKKYIWNLLIAIDQFFNTVFGGDPDETISSRMGKWLRDNETSEGTKGKIAGPICKVLDKFEDNHCAISIEDDEGKDEVL